MHKIAKEDALTALAVILAGFAVVAFSLGNASVGGSASAATLIPVALLVRLSAESYRKGVARLDERAQELATVAEHLQKSHRKTVRATVAQGDRIEQLTDSMTRRIASDINTARVEAEERYTLIQERLDPK